MVERKERYRALFLLGCDLLAAVVALPLAYQFRLNIRFAWNVIQEITHPVLYSLDAYLWFYLISCGIILLFYGYRSELKPPHRFRSLTGQMLIIIEEILIIAFLIGFFSFVLKINVSRSLTLLYLVVMFLLMGLIRLLLIIYFKFRRGSPNSDCRILIAGNTTQIFDLGEKVNNYENLGYKLSGYITDLSIEQTQYPGSIIGSFDQLHEILEKNVVHEVVFIGSENEDLKLFEKVALLCEEQGILTRLSLNFFPHSISRTSLDFIQNQPFLTFSPVPEQVLALMVKRMMDIIGSIIGLILFSPFFLITPLLIKITSRGPVLYRQKRCGLYGRTFTLFKFRSMVEGAEDVLWEIRHLNEMNGPVFKMMNDPRVTKLGRYLRKFSIDELPQFYNILKGDMSLVGPRAPLPDEVKEYTRWQRRRLSVKPGITCIWQVSGRNQVDFDEWMKLDLYYIDNWSLWLDLKIIIQTIPAVVLCRGAR